MPPVDIIAVIITAAVTFVATNIDDILILLLFFSRTNESFRHWHVVAGQYLGFSALVAVSLLGYLTSLVIPHEWIGLLGVIPIVIGVQYWHNRNNVQDALDVPGASKIGMFSAVTSVAWVTFANGGDNIGIYTPLFATSNQTELIITLIVFYVLLGIWCASAYFLTRQRTVAGVITRYGHIFVPSVLIGLGVYILIKSEAYTLIGRLL